MTATEKAKVYGIKSCDTMKKAFKWLEENNLEFEFHDYRKDGINENMVKMFIDALGIELVINKRGTTWRKLPDEIKENVDDNSALSLLTENEAMIKRPIFEFADELRIGFAKKDQEQLSEMLLK